MPRIFETFCKAGGAGKGYHDAGFDVVGLDIEPQPRYPFPFILGDALEVLDCMINGWKYQATDGRWYGLEDFDAFHASTPCQGYTKAAQQWRAAGKEYPDLIAKAREALKATGKPYIIENVPDSPLINPTILNAALFGLRVRRTRLFETSFPMPLVLRPPEEKSNFRMGRPVKDGDIVTPVGHFSNVGYARRQMGIDWMTRDELAQAIPPAYTNFIGRQLLAVLEAHP